MRNLLKKYMITALAFALVLTMAAPAFADDAPEIAGEMLQLEGQKVVPGDSGPDADELFKEYTEMLMDEEIVIMTGEAPEPPVAKSADGVSKSRLNSAIKLHGIDLIIYKKLKAYILEVAEGSRESTVFSIPVNELGLPKTTFSAADLGLSSIISNGYVSEEAMNKLNAKISYDLSAIINLLLSEHPYELYWYDKTVGTFTEGCYVGYEYDSKAGEFVLTVSGDIRFYFTVSKDYGLDTYVVDTSKGTAVRTAISNASSIVSANEGLSDLEKLHAYKDTIFSLVSYNHSATSSTSYGDPWQLIWVFDGDSATDVVCEGYSKAMKFLCDMTKFDSFITCSLMTGTLATVNGSEGHMWNSITMDDGLNYLADLTNCDEGTLGYGDLLFLKGAYDGEPNDGYIYYCGEAPVGYFYDEDSLETYTDKERTMAFTDYIAPDPNAQAVCETQGHDYGDWTVEEAATCEKEGIRARVCHVCRSTETEIIPAAGHSFGPWTEVIAATVTRNGLEQRACSECGAKEDRETERLPEPEPEPIYGTPEIVLEAKSYVYNGKVKTPDAEVWLYGEVLEEDTDYDISYDKGRKNVGRYNVEVTLKGDYEGFASTYFKINPKATSLKTLKASKRAITVNWTRMSTRMAKTRISGYEIQLATNSKFTKNKKTVRSKGYLKTSKKVSSLKAKKTYYVRIRTYKIINRVTYTSKWSKVKKIRTK